MRVWRPPRPEPRAVDPVEALLDFLLALRRFVAQHGRRRPHEDFDGTVTRVRGHSTGMDELRERRDARRRGEDPGPWLPRSKRTNR